MHAPDLTDNATWRQYFALPQITDAALAARNPERGVVIMERDGLPQVHAWEVPWQTLRPLTDSPQGVDFAGISPDGESIYLHRDGYIWRRDFAGAHEPERITAATVVFSLSQSLDGSRLGYATLDERGYVTYYTINGHDTFVTLVRGDQPLSGPLFDFDGRYAVVVTMEDAEYTLKAYTLDDSKTLVGELQNTVGGLLPVAFSPVSGDPRLLATSEAEGQTRPLVWNVATGERIDLPLGDLDGDIGGWGWSPDGRKLLLYRVWHAETHLYLYDLGRSTLDTLDHPGGAYRSVFFAGDAIYALWTDATHPTQVITLDGSPVLTPGQAPLAQPWRSITFPSGGGSQVQAWLATPGDEYQPPYPLIVHAHGGPSDAQFETYSPMAQTFLAHGCAWLSVNYRGSTTFGTGFMQAVAGILGHREVDDLAAGAAWLVAEGIADEHALFLAGSGYGGYLVLQTLGRRPDLWAGGIARTAVADWRSIFDGHAPDFAAYISVLMGGTPADVPKLYDASAATTYADAVTAPLLLFQPANDPNCPPDQIEVYVEALSSPAELIWFDPTDADLLVQQQAQMLHWLYERSGGV